MSATDVASVSALPPGGFSRGPCKNPRVTKFFQRIAAYDRKFTSSESRLVEAIQSRHPHGLLQSARSLAKDVGTSASTVVRLLAKLGYASYAEAQVEARSEVMARLASPGQRAQAGAVGDTSARGALANALLHDQHNLAATFSAIDDKDFDAAVRLLTARHARVHLLGLRQGQVLIAHLALHLNLCLPDVRAPSIQSVLSVDEQVLSVDEHDVLLLVTTRRHSLSIARIARHFRDGGAHVIAITDSALAPAAQVANPCFIMQTSSVSPFDSYTAGLTFCNALVAAVAQRRRHHLSESLEQLDKLTSADWLSK